MKIPKLNFFTDGFVVIGGHSAEVDPETDKVVYRYTLGWKGTRGTQQWGDYCPLTYPLGWPDIYEVLGLLLEQAAQTEEMLFARTPPA